MTGNRLELSRGQLTFTVRTEPSGHVAGFGSHAAVFAHAVAMQARSTRRSVRSARGPQQRRAPRRPRRSAAVRVAAGADGPPERSSAHVGCLS